ncbi:MAG: cytochrome c biogenesis protein CcdA [Micromonosporaceae bacterium]|nr:cytochrome c biogenesis protein CcdA [Micromonosporaceae bacterium]
MGAWFANTASGGPLLLAIVVAAVAGLVSFLSPCVLPLVPGYLSYVTGMAGADLDAARGVRARGRILAGSLLFIAGFTAVFTLTAVLSAQVGRVLLVHERAIEVVIGAVVIALGLAFAGVIPGLTRELRIHRLPPAGVVSAPVLGAVFALSWTPCTGPTLGAVLTLAATGGTDRALVLVAAYCLGLGLPFLAFALGFRKLLGVVRAVRRHSLWVMRVGGALLVLVGLALVTGGWADFIDWLRATIGAGSVSV